MSGSPLEAVAQAIREHQFISWPSNGKQPMCCLCQQGCSGPDGYMLEMDFREHAEHVAVAVLAALELREESVPLLAPQGMRHPRRWVSSWTSGSDE